MGSGRSHEAATAMFRRAAAQQTSQFSALHRREWPTALKKGAGTDRRRADCTVESRGRGGPRRTVSVSDMWVVLIKPARVSAEKAASLQAQAQAQAEQAEINRLLVALGDADSGTAALVQAAAKDFGFAFPGPNDPRSLDPTSGLARPADEVPNPMSLDGLIQQGIVRDNDMAHEWHLGHRLAGRAPRANARRGTCSSTLMVSSCSTFPRPNECRTPASSASGCSSPPTSR